VLRFHWRIWIRPQHEEAFVTQAMLHIDGARTRMPLVCTVISMLVLTVFVALSFMSWLIDTNTDLQDAKSVPVPRSNTSATRVSAVEPPDPYESKSWGKPGRRF
jgi:hypothetical protein